MESKQWYKSKTVWAAFVAMVVGTMSMFGVGQLDGEEESMTELIMQVVTVVSGVVALFGRISAHTTLKLLLLCCLLLPVVGCHYGVTMTPEYRDAVETQAVNFTAQADNCDAVVPRLPEEFRAEVQFYCDTLRAGGETFDAVIAESLGLTVDEYRATH